MKTRRATKILLMIWATWIILLILPNTLIKITIAVVLVFILTLSMTSKKVREWLMKE